MRCAWAADQRVTWKWLGIERAPLMLATIGGPEIIIVALVIVLVFGASQLPKLARSVGQAQKEFKQGLKEGVQDEDEDEDEDEKNTSS